MRLSSEFVILVIFLIGYHYNRYIICKELENLAKRLGEDIELLKKANEYLHELRRQDNEELSLWEKRVVEYIDNII